MTAATGMPVAILACEWDIETIAACWAMWAKIGRVSGLNGPWLVVTTGGRRMPAVPASSGPRKVWSWMTSISDSAS